MNDKVLRTRRIPNEDRQEAIIALLRAEVKAWREAETSEKKWRALDKARAATDAAGALEDK